LLWKQPIERAANAGVPSLVASGDHRLRWSESATSSPPRSKASGCVADQLQRFLASVP